MPEARRKSIIRAGRRPRIAVVSPLLPVKPGSHRGHSLYQTTRRFHPWADVRAFCPVTIYPKHLEPRSYTYLLPEPGYQPEGLHVTFLEYKVFPILSRPVNGARCLTRLRPHLLGFQPDLILNSWLYPEGYASVRIGDELGIPTVHYCVGSDLRRIPDPITGYFTRQVLRNAHGVIAVSNDLANLALKFGAAPQFTHTILNGCDLAVFQLRDRMEARRDLGLPLDPAKKIIIYAGTIVPAKGVIDLVKAIQILTASGSSPDCHVYLLGPGPYSGQLASLIEKLGLSERVTLQGPVPSNNMPRWFTACDVFCLPSHSEGCPNVIVEARASGRPVVATTVGGIPEITNRDSAILVPPHEPPALAKALADALHRTWDPNRIAAGIESWEQVAERAFYICLEAINHYAPLDAAS